MYLRRCSAESPHAGVTRAFLKIHFTVAELKFFSWNYNGNNSGNIQTNDSLPWAHTLGYSWAWPAGEGFSSSGRQAAGHLSPQRVPGQRDAEKENAPTEQAGLLLHWWVRHLHVERVLGAFSSRRVGGVTQLLDRVTWNLCWKEPGASCGGGQFWAAQSMSAVTGQHHPLPPPSSPFVKGGT